MNYTPITITCLVCAARACRSPDITGEDDTVRLSQCHNQRTNGPIPSVLDGGARRLGERGSPARHLRSGSAAHLHFALLACTSHYLRLTRSVSN
jgi:hypothetical protein